LNSTRKHKKKPQGADAFLNDSLDSSFKESTLKSMEEDQKRKKNQRLITEDDDEEEDDHVSRMKELLAIEKVPAQNNDLNDTMSSHYNFVVDERVVKAT
jgi:hypothetical protein